VGDLSQHPPERRGNHLNEFKACFRNHYVPRDTLKLKKKEFSELDQGSMIVNEYLN
jgi:hypothetical protein